MRCQIGWPIAVAVVMFGQSLLLAAGRPVATLPAGGKPNKTGLMLQIDSNWVESDGYRPVWVTATCTPPATGDRTLTITLSTEGSGAEPYKVSANLELAAGASAGRVVIPVPQFGTQLVLSITTAEDGQKINELSAEYFSAFGRPPDTGEMSAVHVTENAAATDTDAFFGNVTQAAGAGNAAVVQRTWGMATPDSYLISRSMAEMPEEWIDLTSLDFVVMSSGELFTMAMVAPKSWQAIRDWTAAGGNLCIYHAGEKYERLPDIDFLLDGNTSAGEADAKPTDNPWTDCDRSLLGDLQQAIAQQAAVQQSGINGMPQNGSDQAPMDPEKVVQALKNFVARFSVQQVPPFKSRDFRLGRVVAMVSDNPFPAAADPAFVEMVSQWHWIRATLGTNRCSWTERHGVAFDGENPEFWNLMIPGVGLPPVNAYRVLITLFVILIGPVNYFVLRRLRRLHFLLFIVPASAMLVTATLLGYALICDGLGTRMRARSYTLLDQRSGQAVTWARLSYYAGLAPYGGLTFPRDTAVYPFQYENGRNTNGYLQRTTAWDDEQHLARGWLPARTLTQLLAVRCGQDRRRLEITPGNTGLEIANHLHTNVAQLVIADQQGRLYYLTGLAAGQTASARLQSLEKGNNESPPIPAAFLSMLSQRQSGPAIAPPSATSPLLGMNRRYYYSQSRVATNVGSSLLEQNLRQCVHPQHATSPKGDPVAIGPTPWNTFGLSPGTYLAIVDDTDPALVGIAGALEEGSLHVIEGKW
jgi:hypothetical protein